MGDSEFQWFKKQNHLGLLKLSKECTIFVARSCCSSDFCLEPEWAKKQAIYLFKALLIILKWYCLLGTEDYAAHMGYFLKVGWYCIKRVSCPGN